MLKKTISYTDLDGNSVTEDHYFAMSIAELVEMEADSDEGIANMLRGIVDSKEPKQIYNKFKDILRSSIGYRTPDGKRFLKSEEYTNEFLSSEAFNELFMEFLTEPNAISDFFMGMLPKQLVDKLLVNVNAEGIVDVQIPAQIQAQHVEMPTEADYEEMTEEEMIQALSMDVQPQSYTDFTRRELLNMPTAQFNELVGTDPKKMNKAQLMIAMQRRTIERSRATGARKNAGKF